MPVASSTSELDSTRRYGSQASRRRSLRSAAAWLRAGRNAEVALVSLSLVRSVIIILRDAAAGTGYVFYIALRANSSKTRQGPSQWKLCEGEMCV